MIDRIPLPSGDKLAFIGERWSLIRRNGMMSRLSQKEVITHLLVALEPWAPIESAPQDGTIIYAWVPHTERKDFKWVETGSRKEVLWRTREDNQAALSHEGREIPLSECTEGWFVNDSLRITQECRPTHWRPLADAPKMEAK